MSKNTPPAISALIEKCWATHASARPSMEGKNYNINLIIYIFFYYCILLSWKIKEITSEVRTIMMAEAKIETSKEQESGFSGAPTGIVYFVATVWY